MGDFVGRGHVIACDIVLAKTVPYLFSCPFGGRLIALFSGETSSVEVEIGIAGQVLENAVQVQVLVEDAYPTLTADDDPLLGIMTVGHDVVLQDFVACAFLA
jgi:hypothetical protein